MFSYQPPERQPSTSNRSQTITRPFKPETKPEPLQETDLARVTTVFEKAFANNPDLKQKYDKPEAIAKLLCGLQVEGEYTIAFTEEGLKRIHAKFNAPPRATTEWDSERVGNPNWGPERVEKITVKTLEAGAVSQEACLPGLSPEDCKEYLSRRYSSGLAQFVGQHMTFDILFEQMGFQSKDRGKEITTPQEGSVSLGSNDKISRAIDYPRVQSIATLNLTMIGSGEHIPFEKEDIEEIRSADGSVLYDHRLKALPEILVGNHEDLDESRLVARCIKMELMTDK